MHNIGLLSRAEIDGAIRPRGFVDYGDLYANRMALLRTAWSRWNKNDVDYVKFLEKNEFYDYAVFMALKTVHGGKNWTEWQYKNDLSRYDLDALAEEIDFWQWTQFEFFWEWNRLKKYANSRGIKIVGDLPMYVAHDSVECFTRPDLFSLDENFMPSELSGNPPDDFSAEGQLWGNPTYNWKAHSAEDYIWWHNRMKSASERFDIIRMDHFRGFEKYYAIPQGASAKEGQWKAVPADFADKVFTCREIIWAEDLGIIDDEFRSFMAKHGFKGMRVMQFCLGRQDSEHSPDAVPQRSVYYTGTHDNPTLIEYLDSLTEAETKDVIRQINAIFRKLNDNRGLVRMQMIARNMPSKAANSAIAEQLMRLCMMSSAETVVIPLADIMRLEGEGRINTPGVCGDGNWSWRIKRQLKINKLLMPKNYNR